MVSLRAHLKTTGDELEESKVCFMYINCVVPKSGFIYTILAYSTFIVNSTEGVGVGGMGVCVMGVGGWGRVSFFKGNCAILIGIFKGVRSAGSNHKRYNVSKVLNILEQHITIYCNLKGQ